MRTCHGKEKENDAGESHRPFLGRLRPDCDPQEALCQQRLNGARRYARENRAVVVDAIQHDLRLPEGAHQVGDVKRPAWTQNPPATAGGFFFSRKNRLLQSMHVKQEIRTDTRIHTD